MTIDVGDWLSQPGNSVSAEPCGLFVPPPAGSADGAAPRRLPVPLRRRDVSATVYADACYADTTETLSYISDVDCSAVFRFPLPPRAAVYRFRAVFGDREVTTRVKPRSQAREEYDLAVSAGHSAAHLSQHEAGCSVFEVSLGNLDAHTEVVVEVGYLRLLERLGGSLEWSHTATWVPPYVGSAGDVAAGADKVASCLPTFAAKVTYSLSYKVDVLAEAGAVRAIECPQPVTLEAPAGGGSEGAGAGAGAGLVRWRVGLSEAVADPSKDLTLAIEMETKAASRSGLRVERSGSKGGEGAERRTVALATFVPPPPPGGPWVGPLRRELWFVVDCSGSMGGTPERQAREAALFFIRDLPLGSDVRFNVTCFGSAHKSLWPQCRPYGPDTEREAVSWVQSHVRADMGGTEMLAALGHVYATPIAPGFTRHILFLTDGGISGHEEQALYRLVATAPAPRPRLLCLGIGHGVHRGLLDGLASRTQGAAVYVVDEEAIAAKAAFLKRAATQRGAAVRPVVEARGALVRAAPHVLPQVVFAGEPLHVLVDVLGCEADAELELRAEYCAEEGGGGGGKEGGAAAAPPPAPLRLSLPLGAAAGPAAAVPEGRALGVLHAMAYIGSLMSGTSPLHVRPDGSELPQPPSPDVVKDTIVRLAVSEHLITPYTSAVGVALRRDPAHPDAAANVVEVPLQVPHGRKLWSTAGQGAPPNVRFACLAAAAPMGMPSPSPVPFAARMAVPVACKPFGAAAFPTITNFGAAPQQPTLHQGFGAAPTFAYAACAAPPPAPPGSSLFGAAPASSLFGAAPASSLFGAAPASSPVPFAGRPGGASKGVFGSAAPPAACAYGHASGAAPSSFSAMAFGSGGPGFDFGANSAPPTESAELSCGMDYEAEELPCAMGYEAEGEVGQAACALATEPGHGASSQPQPLSGPVPAPPAAPQPQAPAVSGPLRGPSLLHHLNLTRDTAGFWAPSPELATALGLPHELMAANTTTANTTTAMSAEGKAAAAAAVAAAASLRPAGLSDSAWSTVLVLAVLRSCLADQAAVWGDMEAKAMAWLGSGWPEGARSPGGTVLALAKALTAVVKV